MMSLSSSHVDDDCPICVAARSGLPITFDALRDEAFLAQAARRELEKRMLRPGEEAEVLNIGKILPNGTTEVSRYTVDADGRVHLDEGGKRSLITRLSR